MRGIKNRDKLTKEGLIISLLKSENSNTECNYMKHFNNTTDDNNNNDDTYDGKIKHKINDIRMTVDWEILWLVMIVRQLKMSFIKLKIRKIFQIWKKNYDNLVELVNTLNKKEKYKYHDHDDLDYRGIRDAKNLFDDADNDDYYKPILVKSSFKEDYKYYKSRGDKDKELSVTQYLQKIVPYLHDIINDQKTNINNAGKWKIQINMHVNFVSSNDTGEIRTIFV